MFSAAVFKFLLMLHGILTREPRKSFVIALNSFIVVINKAACFQMHQVSNQRFGRKFKNENSFHSRKILNRKRNQNVSEIAVLNVQDSSYCFCNVTSKP